MNPACLSQSLSSDDDFGPPLMEADLWKIVEVIFHQGQHEAGHIRRHLAFQSFIIDYWIVDYWVIVSGGKILKIKNKSVFSKSKTCQLILKHC